MEKIRTSEIKILEAARQVFHQRGFNGARMQEIADLAGMNKALVHYYFRSKEKLFETVFNESFSQIASKMSEIFFSEMTLMTKIEIFINFISRNSFVVSFIINAIQDRPEQLREIISRHNISPELFLDQIRKQLKEEMDLDIDPLHIYVNILGLVIFPVVAKPLLQSLFALSDDKMLNFFEQRKKIIPTFIANALKGYELDKRVV